MTHYAIIGAIEDIAHTPIIEYTGGPRIELYFNQIEFEADSDLAAIQETLALQKEGDTAYGNAIRHREKGERDPTHNVDIRLAPKYIRHLHRQDPTTKEWIKVDVPAVMRNSVRASAA